MKNKILTVIFSAVMSIVLITSSIVLTNCSNNTYDGRIHPSNPKLHNIVVLKNQQWESNSTHKIDYFSFRDSAFHSAIIPILYRDLFQVGDTIN